MSNTLLAGPILRRTTQDCICVWLASDKKQDFTLEILDMAKKPVGRSKPKDIGASRIQLGTGLYIYLLKAYPIDDKPGVKEAFELETLYYYSITDSKKNQPLDLKSEGLTYGSHPYPIFHIPGKLKSVLHGSCRKPHGATCQDSLALGDDVLEKTHGDINSRPDLLLLTGDQIYADDVDSALMKVLRGEAAKIMGHDEALPLSEYGEAVQSDLSPSTIALGGRHDVLKTHRSGLSSRESGNHLMGFGEFAAMYIYVFGNAQGWKIPSWPEIEADHVELHGKDKKKTLASIEAVGEFSKHLAKVRRLLANIPTYMIFDDHDVTDDWNITGNWYDKVRTSPLGRRIVSNALAAYWAFQGWGNAPNNFDKELIDVIKIYVNGTTANPANDEQYDLLTWKHRGWGFTVITEPPILAIDSRTQRQSDNAYYPARLLDRYALDGLRLEWCQLKACEGTSPAIDEETCPILVATTPVLGFAPIEHLVRLVLWCVSYIENLLPVKMLESFFKIKGFAAEWIVNLVDGEAWTTNLDGFTNFLDTLSHKMNIKQCVFLSGDVHYSFTAIGTYTSKNNYALSPRTLRCYQLTSSSLRNEPDLSQRQAIDDLLKFEGRKNLWQRFKRLLMKLQFLRLWEVKYKLLASEQSPKIVKECNLGQVYFEGGLPVRHRLWRTKEDFLEYETPKTKFGNLE